MSQALRIAAALGLLATSAGAQVVVTPSNMQGWGIDPIRGAPTGAGVQAINSNQPRSGNGSLMMSVGNNGADRTGLGIMQNFGSLSNLSGLSFDWMTGSPATQSPTLRLYLDVANPTGGRMIGQLGWYSDNSINGTVPTNTWTTSNLLDGDGNNNFFLRFFGNPLVPVGSGQIGTNCVNTNRGGDFNARMQDIASWTASCNGGTGEVNLGDATVIGIALDMGAWPGTGSYTETAYMDNVSIRFNSDATSYNFETDAVVATPEPASLMLVGTGLVGLFGVARRRRAAK